LTGSVESSILISIRNSGAKREVKFAVESYWAGKTTAEELQKTVGEIRKSNWTSVKAHGVDYVPRYVFFSMI
jgi:5-methyltetrahydropteroyltriglutamate--homocysteine methyltransferase